MANKRTRKQKARAATRRPSVPGVAATELLDIPSIDDAVAADEAAAAEEAAAEEATPELAAAAPLATTAITPSTPAGSQARRRVARINASLPAAPERRQQRGQPAGFIAPLESDDAAIPFDRVPYVPADLRRVAIMAAIMVLLIIVADIIVSNVVT